MQRKPKMPQRRTVLPVLCLLCILLCIAAVFAIHAWKEDSAPPLAAVSTEEGSGTLRALLIGVDDFCSAESVAPAASQSVAEMQQALLAYTADANLTVPDTPPADVKALTQQIQTAFGMARDGDINLLYLCTHGVPDRDAAVLLLSDGETETRLTPAQLEKACASLAGETVLVLDACYSGAFIGKGSAWPRRLYFRSDRFHVLTSCGALEPGWYYRTESESPVLQGSFYFSQLLTQGISRAFGYPADRDENGEITAGEWFAYVRENMGVSTPQCLPEEDSLPLFRYDPDAPLPDGPDRGALTAVAFGPLWAEDGSTVRFAYTAARVARVYYQLVPWDDGWAFPVAALLPDTEERYAAPNDRIGTVTAGRKTRALTLDTEPLRKTGGYVLMQILSVEDFRLRAHAARVLAVPCENAAALIAQTPPRVSAERRGSEVQLALTAPCVCRITAVLKLRDGSERELCRSRVLTPTPDRTARLYFSFGTGEKQAVSASVLFDFGGGVTREVQVKLR